MNYLACSAKAVLVGLALTAASCSGDSGAAQKDAKPQAAKADAESQASTINIRYIDGDSIAEHYNLAKDFKEFSLRTYSNLENAQRSRAAEIQKFGSAIEEKMRSNGYLSEASYNGDVQKLNKMQSDAQNYLASLQRKAETEMMQQQQQLNDSIQSFIKDYNAEHGYDAILFRTAGVYFNPALDITNEVIDGLNARYTKVSGK